MSARSTIRKWVMLIFLLGALSFLPKHAMANGDDYSYGEYRYYDPDAVTLGRAYYIDPVNRRSSLTPEPVWRGMFPDIHQRLMNEHRIFGRGGQVDREYRYWRAFGD